MQVLRFELYREGDASGPAACRDVIMVVIGRDKRGRRLLLLLPRQHQVTVLVARRP